MASSFSIDIIAGWHLFSLNRMYKKRAVSLVRYFMARIFKILISNFLLFKAYGFSIPGPGFYRLFTVINIALFISIKTGLFSVDP